MKDKRRLCKFWETGEQNRRERKNEATRKLYTAFTLIKTRINKKKKKKKKGRKNRPFQGMTLVSLVRKEYRKSPEPYWLT